MKSFNRLYLSSILTALVFSLGLAGVGCDGSTSEQPDSGGPKPDVGITGPEGGTDTIQPDTVAAALKPGIIGQYSAVAAKGGTVMASAYERGFGDLLLISAQITALGTVKREIVDGVPSTKPSKDPAGWRGGIEEKGDDVGLHTDILITATGSPMLAYQDKTNNAVKFATKSESLWARHQVAKATGAKEVVGLYNAMTLVAGKPAIAFLATGIRGKDGSFTSQLRLAEATQFVPKTTAQWKVSVIDSKAMPCRNLCDKSASEVCVVKANNTSACQKSGSGCPKCDTGKECVGGKCVAVLADATLTSLPAGVALWPSVVETKVGLLVVYYDRVAGALKAAVRSGAAWKLAQLKGAKGADLGGFSSAAVDKAGTVHVTYQDMLKSHLHYLQLNPSTLKVTVSELVDDGKRPGGIHVVGADSSLSVDPAGVVRVVYQDQQTSDLLYARRSSAGKWTPKVTTNKDLGRLLKGGKKGYGFFSDTAVDGGKVYGSTMYYHPSTPPGGDLEFYTVP